MPYDAFDANNAESTSECVWNNIECLNFLVLHAEFEISYTSQEDGKCLSRNGKIWKSCERSAKRTSNEDTFTVKSQNFSMVL